MAVRFRRRQNLSPEQELLLICARSTLRPDHVAQIRQLLGLGIIWDSFWPLVRAHGVGYFVGHHLKSAISDSKSEIRNPKSESNPKHEIRISQDRITQGSDLGHSDLAFVSDFEFRISDFLFRIQQDIWQETAHALVLRDQQLRLNLELERAAIPAVWLKGVVLAERLYGRFDARHCGDLDLLAQPSDIPRAEELLTRLGFERFRPKEPGKEYHPMAAHHSMWCARALPNWTLVVELHHRLSGPSSCQPSVTDMLQRSQLVEFHGQQMRVPSLEDEMLILCLHAHHHNYASLRCLMDLAEFVRRYHDQIDWPRLLKEASVCRCLGRLRAALEIAHELLGLENHRDVVSVLPQLSPRQQMAFRGLSLPSLLDPRTQQDDLTQARFSFLMDSLADFYRLLAPRLFPEKRHVRTICPPFLRRTPGLPHVYYYLHSAQRALKWGSS